MDGSQNIDIAMEATGNGLQPGHHEIESVGTDGENTQDMKCGSLTPINIFLNAIGKYVRKFGQENERILKSVVYFGLWVGWLSYVIIACVINLERARILIYLFIVITLCITYSIVKTHLGDSISKNVLQPIQLHVIERYHKIIKWSLIVSFIALVITWLIYDTANEPSRLISLAGLFLFTFIGFVFSTHHSRIIWRPVLWGFALQFIFGLLILRTDIGFQILKWVGDRVAILLGFASAGSDFLFPGLSQFAFSVLPIIPYFSALTYLMWYLGVLQVFIVKIGWLLEVTLGTTPVESFNAAANIFIGMTEAPLLVRPFLMGMTESELHAVMTGGFATIAGSVLAIYIHFGISATHLLSASIMSAPAALAMSKLMCPEVEEPAVKRVADIQVEQPSERNVFEAVSEGARLSIGLVANIVVNLIAFLSLLECANSILGWLGYMVGVPRLSFEFISSHVFMPFAFMMGVPWNDSFIVAELLGVKTFLNEFIAYQRLSVFIKNRESGVTNAALSIRGEIIATYALCGFANFGSMGVMLGGISSLVPSKRGILAKHVLRALIAGTLACFMTACVAGLLYDENAYGALQNGGINGTIAPTNLTVTSTVNGTPN